VVDTAAEQFDADAEVSRAVFQVAVLAHPLERALTRHEHRRAKQLGLGLLHAVPVPTSANPSPAKPRRVACGSQA
jgi:hypothetical protein